MRENVLGIGVSPINMAVALTTIREWIEGRQRRYVCVTGVHGIMEGRRSAEIRAIHNAAGMVTPDGMPLVWLLKFAGHSHVDRVYGPDLMLAVFGTPSFSGCRHFFYGTTETTLERLAGRLKARFPHAQIVGSIAPPFRALTAEEDEAMVARLNAAEPDIVWVGLSTPKQERWMAGHRDRLKAPVLIGVGAAFDIHAGIVAQAPKVLQRSGFEWAFRLWHDPHRLWRRYLVNNPLFLANLVAQKTKLRRFDMEESEVRDTRTAMMSDSPYAKRLRKEAHAAWLAHALSVLSPRLPRQPLAKPARIGILAQWGIGDAVLLLPLLRGLKEAFPNASLALIGKPWLSDLFADEGCADEFHTLVPPWTTYENKYRQPLSVWARFGLEARALRRRKLEWLISARFDPRENLELRMLRARHTFGFSRAGGRFWLTQPITLDRSSYDAQHRAHIAAEVARLLTGTRPVAEPTFRKNPKEEAHVREWLARQGYCGGVILAVHSGAGHPLRRWREFYFESVLKSLLEPPSFIILIDDERQEAKPVWLPVPGAVWRGNLRALKAVLAVSDIFLGVDSGIMHMAAAAGCRVVAAFGPGEPRWFRPSGHGHEIGVVEPMTCRPCFDACIHPSPLCLDRFDEGEFASLLDRQLKRVRNNGATRRAVDQIAGGTFAIDKARADEGGKIAV
jgi:N-acetylglucosaminyldiphosphoundecaprenol N-acetyl-beta-D-mannosaminyltransferase